MASHCHVIPLRFTAQPSKSYAPSSRWWRSLSSEFINPSSLACMPAQHLVCVCIPSAAT